MATKTIILRPTGFNFSVSNTQVTVCPADTPQSEYHLLVSEELADNEATYITFSTNLPTYGLLFTPNRGHITPTSIRLISIMRTTNSNGANVQWKCAAFNSDDGEDYTFGNPVDENTITVTSSEFSLYATVFSNEIMLQFWKFINSSMADQASLHITASVANPSSGSKSSSIDVTQLYLEVDYEEEPLLYIREENNWSPIYGAAYIKTSSGTWESNSLEHLTANTKIIIKEVP